MQPNKAFKRAWDRIGHPTRSYEGRNALESLSAATAIHTVKIPGIQFVEGDEVFGLIHCVERCSFSTGARYRRWRSGGNTNSRQYYYDTIEGRITDTKPSDVPRGWVRIERVDGDDYVGALPFAWRKPWRDELRRDGVLAVREAARAIPDDEVVRQIEW